MKNVMDRFASTYALSARSQRAAVAGILAVMLAALWPLPSRAMLLTPPTKPGRFTLGATEMWIHRDLEWTGEPDVLEGKYNLGAIWAKYGIHRRLTFFAEFALLNGDPHNTGTSRRYYNLGLGANVLLFDFEDFYVSGLVNYLEAFQHDNQEYARHSVARHFVALLQIGREFPLGTDHTLTAWWGPAYVSEEGEEEEAGFADVQYESQNDFGGAVGLDVLFWDHLEFFTHVVYADYFQPRLGIGYRF